MNSMNARNGAGTRRFPGVLQKRTWESLPRVVKRLGFGAMQLAGPGVFGLPKDHDAAIGATMASLTHLQSRWARY
jgi:hypothetical protein